MKKFVCIVILFALVFSGFIMASGSLKANAISLIKATIPSLASSEEATEPVVAFVVDSSAVACDVPAEKIGEEAEVLFSTADMVTHHEEKPTDPQETSSGPEGEEQLTESSVAPETADETVYACTDVYVRTGPAITYEQIAMLNKGDSITRTGFSDNGWSRVIYSGQDAYICSDYLSVTFIEADTTEAPTESYSDTTPTQEPKTNITVTPLEEKEETITFADTNETVYATTTVNVRTGPGVSYEKVGMCYYAESITRTGIGSNGWSRISYNGQTAFMHSDYLSTTKPEPIKKKLGTTGRLTIPSVGVDVALYYCNSSGTYVSQQQAIVDAADSAAYLDPNDFLATPGGYIIADHKHQGFNAMKNSVPYQTYAYIDFGSYVQKYICIGIGLGQNLGNDLVDWDGVSLNFDYIRGGLAMYTCNENSRNITISYWQPV